MVARKGASPESPKQTPGAGRRREPWLIAALLLVVTAKIGADGWRYWDWLAGDEDRWHQTRMGPSCAGCLHPAAGFAAQERALRLRWMYTSLLFAALHPRTANLGAPFGRALWDPRSREGLGTLGPLSRMHNCWSRSGRDVCGAASDRSPPPFGW